MSTLASLPKRKWDQVEQLDEPWRRFSRPKLDTSNVSPSPTDSYIGNHQLTTQSRLSDDLQQLESLHESNPTHVSPVASDILPQTHRRFDEHASIVLIGISGTGKSSLAVILATTSGKRLIDGDQYFQQVTGRSRTAFKKDHDRAQYRQQEARVMESMLTEHKEGCVIACGPGSMEHSEQKLLQEYSRTHPVIHILRDPESIQSYLQACDTNQVRRLLELSGPIYRSCTNLEFFNVSERGVLENGETNGHHYSPLDRESEHRLETSTPFLTLKRLQRDFLRFIAFATGDITDMSGSRASFPLNMLPIESRMFTYAISVPMSALLEQDVDIEELESTADAFELKLDVVNRTVDSSFADKVSETVATIRRNIIVPLIYHVESAPFRNSTIHSRRAPQEYLELVQHGLRLAPEFLTVDLSYDDTLLSQIISSKGLTRIIGDYASTERAIDGWDGTTYIEIYERARKLGCDIVRLSQRAESITDNFDTQRFRHRIESLPGPPIPLIAYNSGLLGRLSCCFNPILTPVTHQSLKMQELQGTCQPSITVREAQEALYASFTLDPMQFFVFGANVTYSLSPAMHNTAYRACGLPHKYSIHQSPSLRGLKDLVENPNFGGTSVSLPYKTEVIPLLHSMSPHARAIGAVNTLIPLRKINNTTPSSHESTPYLEKSRAGPVKALHGDNTDWIGMGNCIRRGLSPINAVQPSTTGLVIGAGGMARAAVYSMIQLGVENIFVYNRTVANAHKMAHHYNRQKLHRGGVRARPTLHVLSSLQDAWPADYKPPTIVVSCIPAHSIAGERPANFEMPQQWLGSPNGGVVVEVSLFTIFNLVHCLATLSLTNW